MVIRPALRISPITAVFSRHSLAAASSAGSLCPELVGEAISSSRADTDSFLSPINIQSENVGIEAFSSELRKRLKLNQSPGQ